MKLVLAFHGTRDPRGAVVCEEIASLARSSVDVPVEVAYADVRQPDVRSVVDGPAVVVPAFLAAGYHVRVDIPQQIGSRPDVVVTPPLGVDAVAAVRDRLREAGFRRGDAVVLAAAGSSDARALADVRRAAGLLGASAVGYVATATPRVPDVVAEVRERRGMRGRRVAVASWLLAPGVFHGSLAECGADVVSAPIGAHPLVVDVLLRRYYEARAVLLQSA
ncbi:sirohydrochlorin chelatase [Lentzea aerocolonigenes]|uniref:sirohydrochlorin chelatase n=1 Tax=Lentzea aerocolonigenes TaxID=68170 RepID=UPI0004C315AE|nr:CbiX/SirB N-terminal domain-containing protein [Lentzea aerocolonigenes]MCP2249487.1 Sirohydrochlorin ferrochelatase [Lentzea aerocolonigenes]